MWRLKVRRFETGHMKISYIFTAYLENRPQVRSVAFKYSLDRSLGFGTESMLSQKYKKDTMC